MKMINESKAVVTATKLYEGQPTLLCEASVSSVPSIFPDYGGISEFFPKIIYIPLISLTIKTYHKK